MEKISINPNDVVKPEGLVERLGGLIAKEGVTDGLIARLAGLDVGRVTIKGKEIEVSMDHVKIYIDDEYNFYTSRFPDGYRYNKGLEKSRKTASNMHKDFVSGNFRGLIIPFLKKSAKAWGVADLMDKRALEMDPEARKLAVDVYQQNLNGEKEINERERKTGRKEEHGIPPELLEVGGGRSRYESHVYLSFAVVLAKKVIDNKSK